MNALARERRVPRTRGTRHLVVAALIASTPLAQADEPHFLELGNGDRVAYTLRAYPADAQRLDAGAALAPSSALNTAKLLTRYLAEGRLEDAAMLSNAPKARFARFRESFEGWTDGDFKRAYGRYFAPQNRIVGEAAIDGHRLLMWYLRDTDYLAGFFFVDIDGRLLLDDVPSEARSNLQRILEAYRSGRLK